jgi:hypothetical protein
VDGIVRQAVEQCCESKISECQYDHTLSTGASSRQTANGSVRVELLWTCEGLRTVCE